MSNETSDDREVIGCSKLLSDEILAPCSVYLMAAKAYCEGAYFKIGISDDPKRRLKQIQTATPFEIQLCARWKFKDREEALKVEKILHKVFKDNHTKGEWFYVDYIDDMKEKTDLYGDVCGLTSDDFKQYNLR